jgi:hypothetical protein
MVDTFTELYVGLLGVLYNVVRLLLDRLYGRLLDNNSFGEVLEKLVQLFKGLLDLLNVIVAGADGAKDRGCGAGTVRFELSCYVSRFKHR